MDFSDLKTRARKSLEGKWKDTLIVFVVFSVLTSISVFYDTSNLTSDQLGSYTILNILGLVFGCLFGFGFISYFLKLSRNEETDYRELFSKTNLAIEYFILSFLIAIFTFLWALLFIIPGIIAAIRYSQALFIKVDNPDLGAMECINKSKELMKNHKMDYFLLMLSFLGWMILGIFTFGILYLWLIPYYYTTICNFYNKIKE